MHFLTPYIRCCLRLKTPCFCFALRRKSFVSSMHWCLWNTFASSLYAACVVACVVHLFSYASCQDSFYCNSVRHVPCVRDALWSDLYSRLYLPLSTRVVHCVLSLADRERDLFGTVTDNPPRGHDQSRTASDSHSLEATCMEVDAGAGHRPQSFRFLITAVVRILGAQRLLWQHSMTETKCFSNARRTQARGSCGACVGFQRI